MKRFRGKPMAGRRWWGAGVLAALALLWWGMALGTPSTMPEFTTNSPDLWINSKPLTKADLRGNVVLLEVWTSI